MIISSGTNLHLYTLRISKLSAIIELLLWQLISIFNFFSVALQPRAGFGCLHHLSHLTMWSGLLLLL